MPSIIMQNENCVIIKCEYVPAMGKQQLQDASKFEEMYCKHCTVPNTRIAGDYTPIEAVEDGSHVYGAAGEDTVLKTFVREYEGKLVKIMATGMLPIRVSPEHPVLVVHRQYSKTKKRKITLSQPHFKTAEKIIPLKQFKRREEGKDGSGDYLMIPIIKGTIADKELSLKIFEKRKGPKSLRVFPLNVDTAWLLGMYVAEGVSYQNVRFCMGKHEEQKINKLNSIIKNMGFSPRNQECRTTTEVILQSRVLARAFAEWCKRGALNKQIPEFIFRHKNLSIIQAFIKGYIDGDGGKGHYSLKKGKKTYFADIVFMTTASEKLALQLQMLAARIRVFIRIYKQKRKETEIQGRHVNMHDRFDLRWNKIHRKLEDKITDRVRKIEDNYMLVPIRKKIEEQYKGKLYNIKTKNETYLISNAVVHNCGYMRDAQIKNEQRVNASGGKENFQISCISPKSPYYEPMLEELRNKGLLDKSKPKPVAKKREEEEDRQDFTMV